MSVTNNPVLSGIPTYVDESREELIAKAVLGGDSQKLFNLMTGVKGATHLHLLDTEITLQDGSSCGFEPTGTQTISKRVLTPAILKVNMQYCEKNFLGTYAAHNLRVAAGQETLPYEQKFIEEVLKALNNKIEILLFQGDSDNTAEFDGIIKNLDGSAISVERGANMYATLKSVYAAIPETELLKDDCVIMVSPADFRQFVQELVAANLYHYDANDKAGEIYLPGTNCKVISRNGLIPASGSAAIIAGSLSGIYVGVDMEGDAETFDFWYSQDDQLYKLNIAFAMGTQVAYPDQYVLVDAVPAEDDDEN